MSGPRYTLDQLVVLDAIVASGSFAGAARRLHRVPSAVTYAVQTLETALGVELFDRSGHRAVLTAPGRELWAEARPLLERARTLDALATTLAEGWEAELHVVVDAAWPLGPLLAAATTLEARGIPTQLRIDVETQDGVIDRFDADHAAFMIALGLEDGGRLKGRPLPPIEMVLAVAAHHPLAALHPADRDALASHLDLVVKDSSPAYAHTPRRSYLGTRRVLRVSDFATKLAALRRGLGFGWMPLHLVADELAAGRLVLVDLPDGNRWTYHPQLVTRRDEPPGRAAATLMALIFENLE